ncbi:hypothetical protein LCGC14_1703620, partial [marine sediment metagenome]
NEGPYFASCGCDDGMIRGQCGSVGEVIFSRRLLYKSLLIAQAYFPSGSHEITWDTPTRPIFIRNATDFVDQVLIVIMPIAHTSGSLVTRIEDEPGMVQEQGNG